MTRKEILDKLARSAADIKNQIEYMRDIGVGNLPSPSTSSSSDRTIQSTTTSPISKAPSGPPNKSEPPRPSANQNALFSAISDAAGQADISLEAIRTDIGDCTRCKLSECRTNIVFGEGNPNAELMFVGEGPGADEDRTGRPFVGRAGQLLDRMIEAMKLKREDVYIANVVKCRPPGNRTPERDETATCEPFLFRQIALIKPSVIVTLGLPAFQCLLKTNESMSRSRGVWREWNGIKVMPTFHPAYLLRSPDKKRETWEDLMKVMEALNISV